MAMTHRWADRSLAESERGHDGRQALYGVVQGGIYEDLRQESAEFVSSRPFFGHAVGGCLGEHQDQMYDVVDYGARHLAAERPVHLLGIGGVRSEEHTSELQSLMRNSSAVFCLKKKKKQR